MICIDLSSLYLFLHAAGRSLKRYKGFRNKPMHTQTEFVLGRAERGLSNDPLGYKALFNGQG
jgi:hypothetical protein